MKKIIQLLTYIFICYISQVNMQAQTAIISTESACIDQNNGSITIEIDWEGTSYSLPLTGSYENVDADSYKTFTMDSNPFILEEMEIGAYDIIINLDNNTHLIACTEILSRISILETITQPCSEDGLINISVSGGSPPYDYVWSNGISGTNQIDHLTPGNYSITISDVNNCSQNVNYILKSPIIPSGDPALYLPCKSSYNNGKIFLDYDENLTYSWSNGSSEDHIDNLLPGFYCVTITNEAGCSIDKCISLPKSNELGITNTDIINSCPNIQNGSISLTLNENVGFTVIIWEDLDLFETINKTHVEGLSPGKYVVRLINHCETIRLEIEVEVDCNCEEFLAVDYGTKSPCPNESNGSIFLKNYSSEEFDFNWSNGSNSSIANSLAVGNYQVTISSNKYGCTTVKNIVLEEYKELNIHNTIVEKSCKNEGTGKIQFEISGGHISNAISWETHSGSYSGSSLKKKYEFDNLETGTFKITFSNTCEEKSIEFYVPVYDINVNEQIDFSCNTGEIAKGNITVNCTGENPPFEYNWNNGSTASSLSDLSLDIYKLTITDAIGCEEEFEFNVSFIQNIIIEDACEGINDGSYSFEIFNPNLANVTVQIPDVNFPDNPPITLIESYDNPVQINFDNLEGFKDYTVMIRIGDCFFEYTFQVEEEIPKKSFFGTSFVVESEEGEDIHFCHVAYTCKNNTPITGAEIAFVDFSSSAPDDCCGVVEILCGQNVVDEIPVERKRMRMLQYRDLLLQFLPLDQVETFIDGWDPCDFVWTCPNNPLECLGGHTSEPFFGGSYQDQETLPNGCIKIICDGIIPLITGDDYEYCPGEGLLPSEITAYLNEGNWGNSSWVTVNIKGEDEEIPIDCSPVTESLGVLLEYYPYMNNLPEFNGSPLDDFMTESLGHSGALCAQITYCQTDFRIINEDLDEVDCELPPPPDVDSSIASCNANGDGPCQLVYCNNLDNDNNDYNGVTTVCFDDPPGFGSGSSNLSTKIISNQNFNTSFSSFSYSFKESGINIPNAFFSSENTSYFHAFNGKNSFVIKPVDELLSYFQDFNKDEYFEFYKPKNGIIKTGYFKSGLKEYNSINVSKFNSFSEIMVQPINNNFIVFGSSRNEYISEIYDRDMKFLSRTEVFSKGLILNDQSNIILQISNDYNSSFNGINLNQKFDNGELIRMSSISQANSIHDIRSDLFINGEITIIDYLLNDSEEYFLISGLGELSDGSNVIQIKPNETILAKVADNNIIWSKVFSSTLNNSIVTLALGKNNIYVGSNVIGILEVDDKSYISKGSSDVLILEYSSSGDFIKDHHYGNKGYQSLDEMYFNGNLLFIGGQLKGNETKNQIGEMCFYNFSKDYAHAYISYIVSDDSTSTLITNKAVSSRQQKAILENRFKIQPNPAYNYVIISTENFKDYTKENLVVEIINSIGKLVREEKLLGKMNKLNISDLDSGIYYFQFKDENKAVEVKKLVKI